MTSSPPLNPDTAPARGPRGADAPGLELLGEHACFGGSQRFYRHDSLEIGLPMKFGVYLPPAAVAEPERPVPTLLYLAGLTCTEETFPIKAGAQRFAAEHGIALVSPDTSPRGPAVESIEGAKDHWDFGIGAGFYLDATQEPWSRHWRMESYLVRELVPLLGRALPVDTARLGIMGHSMGGHGALTLALRHPRLFRSLSAIARPRNAPGATRPSATTWARTARPGRRTMPRCSCSGRNAFPTRKASSWTRARRTISSRSSCTRTCSKPPAGSCGSRSRCAGMRATTTATTSSRR
jgi:S-formylglutathione hydrolase